MRRIVVGRRCSPGASGAIACRWDDWSESLDAWYGSSLHLYAGAPVMPLTPDERRLTSGTRLRRVAISASPRSGDGAVQETLFQIIDGAHRGGSLVAVSAGRTPLLPAMAGLLIAPDHPPARDANVALRLLAAGWAAVEHGLPFEE